MMRNTTAETKRVLAPIFGTKNVSVKGGRGTAYGWTSVRVTVARPDGCYCADKVRMAANDEWTCRTCRDAWKQTNDTITAATDGINYGHFYADDGYGTAHSQLSIEIEFTAKA